MKAIGIFAIDSWHLTGGHFPSVSCTAIYDSIDDVLDRLMITVNSYELKTSNHTPITREMLKQRVAESKYNNFRIRFEYPREGEIQIEFEP